jgi:hypothetical protein
MVVEDPRQQYVGVWRHLTAAAALAIVPCGAASSAAAAADPAGLALARKVIRAHHGAPGVEVRSLGIVEGVPAAVVLRYALSRGRITLAVARQIVSRATTVPGGGTVPAGTRTIVTDYRQRELLTHTPAQGCWFRAPVDPRTFPSPRPLLPLDASYGRPRRQGGALVLRQTLSDGDALDLVIDRRTFRVLAQRGVAGSVARTSGVWRALRSAPARPATTPRC